MTLEEIIQTRDLKQKELTRQLRNKSVIDEQYGSIALEIAKLEVKKRELGNAKTKVNALINVLRIEIDNLKDAYFQYKTIRR